MVVESKKRKVRTVVDFGFLDGCTVCRVRTVNADGGSSVRNLNAEKSVKTLLETALGERITDRPFRKMASFWIEPRRISGSVGKEEGTMWAEYRIYPSCISVVSEIVMEIYSTIINSCKKNGAAGKGDEL